MSYVIVGAVSLLVGGLVNYLANWLPQFSRTAGDDEEPSIEKIDAEPATRTDSQPESESPQPRWVRYGLVEVIMLAAGLYFWGREGLSALFFSSYLYSILFLLIAVIDIEHRLILDVVMLPAFIISLIEVALSGRITFMTALAGYAVGQIVIMALFLLAQAYIGIVNANRKNPVNEVPFGFGDVALVTLCGLIVGLPDIIFLMILMIIVGGVLAILFIIGRLIVVGKYEAHTPMPYGPAILIAASLILFWGEAVIRLMWR